MTPQLLWRWELGGARRRAAPAGVYLTDARAGVEPLVLPDRSPPDDMLVAAASAGTLRANLGAHVDRILAHARRRGLAAARDEDVLLLNQLPGDHHRLRPSSRSSAAAPSTPISRSHRACSSTTCCGTARCMDLITSRKAFVNTQPRDDDLRGPGAGGRDGDELRRDDAARRPARRHAHQRGLHHDARPGRPASASCPRGLGVKALFLCLETPPPPETSSAAGRAGQGADDDAGAR